MFMKFSWWMPPFFMLAGGFVGGDRSQGSCFWGDAFRFRVRGLGRRNIRSKRYRVGRPDCTDGKFNI